MAGMARKLSNRTTWLVTAAAALVLLLGSVYFLYWRWDAVRIVVVQPQELVQSVVATATVQTRHRANMGVQIAGTVEEVPVMEGDTFKSGQLLLQLDDREARAAADAAVLAVRQAELRWQQWHDVLAPQAQEAVKQALANQVQALAQFERQEDLFRQGFVGQAALDEAQRTYRVADAQAQSAIAQGNANLEGGVEQQLVQSSLIQARDNLSAAQTRLSYTMVRAPFAGRVVSRSVEPGDIVPAGKTLLVLAPEGVTELVAQIDERNLALLKPGQRAKASADAYPGQQFLALVDTIAPGVDPQRGAIQVKLVVDSPPNYLRQDMTVSVEIEVARRSNALSVPIEAIHEIDTSHPWVWTLDEASRAQRVGVRLGVRSANRVEVISGLVAGSRVLIDSLASLKDGERVRTAKP